MDSTETTSQTDANVATVQGIYEAFGRGDVPAVLDRLADDVQWEAWADNHAQRAGVPWMTPRTGRDGVAEFFSVVGALEIREFSVRAMMAGGNQVVAEVVIDAQTPDGGRYRDEELHLWTFDDAGGVARMRHYADTAKHAAAAAGTDTTAG
jgi:ketosteroid isomerase-like protein